MNVYLYNVNDPTGTPTMAVGVLGAQLANSWTVSFPAAPGLVLNNNYWLTVGAPLQTANPRQNGYPTDAQLQNVNGTNYTFIV